jgi:ubiquitin-activating enzyme E1
MSTIKMEIDTDLYSRQIGAFGMETMGKLIQMHVLVYGCRGLGTEVIKNIILAGPKRVSIYDPVIAQINDLGSNFYLNESHINKTRRDVACLSKFQELNPYVKVDVPDIGEISNLVSHIKDYDIVVITEMLPRGLLETINDTCRENKSGFIYSVAAGISGFTFVDFGVEHIIRDVNGEECKQYIVRNISNDKPGIVLIDDSVGKGRLDFVDGDHVIFREVKGMSELNDKKPRAIKYISPIGFSIDDTTGYGEYEGGGIVEQVKVKETHSYSSLKERFDLPYAAGKVPDPIDLSKFGRNELLHIGFIALHRFYSENNRLPFHNCKEDSDKVLLYAKEYYNYAKEQKFSWIANAAEFSDKIIENIALWSRSHIAPVTSFLGGIVAQEIIKFTGKYTPINQWLWFDFFETVENLVQVDRSLKSTRYDDQIAIYGNELQEKLFNLNIFMIGAGALGCEFLKEFALMGISTKNGLTTVTDNDNIEISNLNRQFLFRRENVNHPKSKTACKVVKQMNADYNCKDLQLYVAPETENIFDDKFWTSQDFIINAVDNIKARKYIDSRCTWFGRPLIDSGTLGTKAHVQIIYPHVTCCYNDTQDADEEAIAMCTLRNFPATIEHCIEWGRTHFTEYFTDLITDARKFIVDPNKFYSDMKKEGNITTQLEKLTFIKKLIELSLSQNFDRCIEYAVEKFTEYFDHNIQQLLHSFPADYVNKDGSKFWSGSKRVPHYIKFNPNDELSLLFVASYSILLANALSIQPNKDFDYIKQISGKVNIPEFQPKNIKIKINDNETDDHHYFGQDEEKHFTSLVSELSIYETSKQSPTMFKPHEFEKDHDDNFHIDFIHACSNLRAENYTIQVCDRQKTKMIAGKIIPAIATTTASITGLVALQLYTLLQTNKIEFMRNVFMNLAVNLFVLTEPGEKQVQRDSDFDPILLAPVKAVPEKWSVWDKIIVDGPLTVKQFIQHFKEKYGVEIMIIMSGSLTMMQTFQKSNADRYDKTLEQIYTGQKKLGDDQKYLIIEVSANTKDGSTALMPLIQYNFRK